jgi:RNA polymerase sigma-70 factor, ECF subfamily
MIRSDAAGTDAEHLDRAIDAFRQGCDPEASFRVIFDHYYPVVLRFFRKRIFSAEDQLDLTQETFLRVYRGLEGFRREAQFGTWLFRIAHNTYLKWLRRLHPDETGDAVALPESDSEPGRWDVAEPSAIATDETAFDDVLSAERQQMLRDAVDELPGQMREATELRVYQELSYREIAVVMRLSVETGKVHLFQARKKLKKKLQDEVPI